MSMPAGRAGEAPSTGLTERLVGLGFETDRLKTGTPARVDKRTVNFAGGQAGGQAGGAGCAVVALRIPALHDPHLPLPLPLPLPPPLYPPPTGLEAQPGDDDVRWFSFDPAVHQPRPQLACYLTHTTAETHRILRVGGRSGGGGGGGGGGAAAS